MKALRKWSKEGTRAWKLGKPTLWNQESQMKEEGCELMRKTIGCWTIHAQEVRKWKNITHRLVG